MDKSCAAESPKAWWHSVKLHKCIWRDIPVLVLILIRNKNPISKLIKNYFDLGNLGIIANVKSLVSNSQVPIHPFLILSPLVHSTNLICFSGKAPNVRNERTQPPDHYPSLWICSAFGTCYHIFRGKYGQSKMDEETLQQSNHYLSTKTVKNSDIKLANQI